MTTPDRDTPEGHKAYRHKLRSVARGQRVGGLLLIILGALALVFAQLFGENADMVRLAGFAAMLVGWLLMAAAIRRRSAYHAERITDE